MKIKYLISLCMIVILVFALPSYPQLADSPWPQYRHDPQNTCRSSFVGPENADVLSKYNCSLVYNPPSIGSDGTIYFWSFYSYDIISDFHYYFYALEPDISERWYIELEDWSGSPAISNDGTIYQCSNEDYRARLYSLNPDGSFNWTFYTENEESDSPVIGQDGMLYLYSFGYKNKNHLYAINTGGYMQWMISFDKNISFGIGHNGTIYIANGAYLQAYYPGGKLWSWQIKLHDNVFSPVIRDDDTIYCISKIGEIINARYYLNAVNPDGSLMWQHYLGKQGYSAPALGKDGAIYLYSAGKDLVAINQNGEEMWSLNIGYAIINTMVVDKNGTIYLSVRDSYVYAVNPDGTLKWMKDIGDYVMCPPVIGSNQILYIGASDNLVIIGDTSEDLTGPNVDVISPANLSKVFSNVELEIRALDLNEVDTVEVKYNSSDWQQCEQKEDNWFYYLDVDNYSIGTRIKIQARATDKSKNKNIGYSKEHILIRGYEEYFVANSGSDILGKGTKDRPWKTITHALQTVDTSKVNHAMINVLHGTYNRKNGETFPLEMWSHVSIKGQNPHDTIIDATGANDTAILLEDLHNCYLENLTITGGKGRYSYGYEYHPGPWPWGVEWTWFEGGGIYCVGSTLHIKNCFIEENSVSSFKNTKEFSKSKEKFFTSETMPSAGFPQMESYYYANGGGIACSYSDLIITNSLIANNSAKASSEGKGGGILSYESTLKIYNTTIADNSSSDYSGAIDFSDNLSLENCIVWGNGFNSITNGANISYSNIEGFLAYQSNISSNPLFVTGPYGDYYLSQKVAGQSLNSPCIDAGSDLASNLGLAQKTTRTDGVLDSGQVDMGYHYPPPIQFELYLSPEKESYQNGDILTIKFDFSSAPQSLTADIYLALYDPLQTLLSGMSWLKGVNPAVSSVILPGGYTANGNLLSFTIPSEMPPVSTPGTYILALAAAKPGTMDLISNIATARFEVK